MNKPLPETIEATVVPAPPKKERSKSRGGISLASLFVITTAAAVLASAVAPVGQRIVSGKVDAFSLGLALVCGLFGGLFLGLVLGMHQYHRGRGALLGGAIGAGLGLLAGPIALLPVSMLRPVAMAMFIGSLLMIGVAILMRPGRG